MQSTAVYVLLIKTIYSLAKSLPWLLIVAFTINITMINHDTNKRDIWIVWCITTSLHSLYKTVILNSVKRWVMKKASVEWKAIVISMRRQSKRKRRNLKDEVKQYTHQLNQVSSQDWMQQVGDFFFPLLSSWYNWICRRTCTNWYL